MHAVADAMHRDWDRVTDMRVREFFNVLSYLKDKAAHDEAETQQYINTH